MTSQAHAQLLKSARRVQNALDQRSLLPFQSLQYRLTEVGRSRIHPIELRTLLRLLSRPIPKRSQPGEHGHPWEPARDLFASPELTSRAALSLAKSWAGRLRSLAELDWVSGMSPLVAALTEQFEMLALESDVLPARSMVLGGDEVLRGFSSVFTIETAGWPVRLWLTEEAGWISPDDPRLWAFLNSCQSQRTRPLIIARQIDPASFVLFKALGVRGLQYYNLWVPDTSALHTAEVAEDLGWFKVKPATSAAEHPLLQKVPSAIEFLAHADDRPEAAAAIALAVDIGLTDSTAQTHGLLRWAERSPCAMPAPWVETVRRWHELAQIDSLETSLTVPLSPKRAAFRPRVSTTPAPSEQSGEEPSPDRKTTVSRVPMRIW